MLGKTVIWLKTRWHLLVVLLLGIGFAYGILTVHLCGRPTSLQRKMRVGDQWRYTLTQTFQLNDQSAQIQLSLMDTVVAVKPDGSAIVERVLQGDSETIKTLQEQMSVFGKLPERMRLRFTPDGEEIPLENTASFLTSVPYAFPPKAVRRGDEWEKLQTIGSMQTRYRCRFSGLKQIDGVACWEITAQAEPLPDSLPQIRGETKVYLDVKQRWTRAMHGTLTMSAGNLQGKLTLDLKGQPVAQGEQQ